MAIKWNELPPGIRHRLREQHPELFEIPEDIRKGLEEANQAAEELMAKIGERKDLREAIEKSKAYLRGEILAEEM